MKNISLIQILISLGLFGIFLLDSLPAFADSDRENFTKLQVQQNQLASGLKILQSQVRDVNPAKWELKSLRSLIDESSCLDDKHLDLETNIPNRHEFAIALDKCFQGLEKVAADKDPSRLIRKNLTTFQMLRNESLLELVRMNSSYIGNSAISSQLRILYAPFENGIPVDDMRSLRYLITKYFQFIQFSYQGYPCEIGNYSKIQRKPINRIEFAGALNSVLDKINELISSGMSDKVDKNELLMAGRLSKEFEAEMATYRGILCALERDSKIDLNTYLDAKSVKDLDYISKP